MTDIVDRLRALNADFLHEEAADEIERLRAERDENERAIAVWRGRTQRAEAEIERLRSAMRELLADTQHAAHACGDPDCPVDRACALLTEGER